MQELSRTGQRREMIRRLGGMDTSFARVLIPEIASQDCDRRRAKITGSVPRTCSVVRILASTRLWPIEMMTWQGTCQRKHAANALILRITKYVRPLEPHPSRLISPHGYHGTLCLPPSYSGGTISMSRCKLHTGYTYNLCVLSPLGAASQWSPPQTSMNRRHPADWSRLSRFLERSNLPRAGACLF